jgi:hypothetical protein
MIASVARAAGAAALVALASCARPAVPLATAVPAAPPRVFVLRAEHLARARAGVRVGEARFAAAYDALLADARAALRVGPFSVMQKRGTPSSGDKHDYLSVGPYWWPDGTKPGGLPYVRRDGEVNVEGRRDSDVERLYPLVTAVNALAHAYWFGGDEAYARRAALLLRTWFLDPATRMNPNLRFGQAIPGVTEGRGVGIVDTRDLSEIVDDIGLLAQSPSWTAADQRGMLAWMRDYLAWLQTSAQGQEERAASNNHGVFYDAQVVSLALFVGDTALARLMLEGYTRERLDRQVEPDGRQPEELARTRPLHYSLFSLEAFARLAEMGRHVGVDLWRYQAPRGGSVRAAIAYVAPYADPAVPFPMPQVNPTTPDAFILPLRRAAAALGDPSLAAPLAKLPPRLTAADRSRLFYPEVP